MKNKNIKVSYIFLAFLMFLLFFSNKSFAALSYDKTIDFTIEGITYTIPDLFSDNTDYTDCVVIASTSHNNLANEETNKQRSFYVYLYNSADADLVYNEGPSLNTLRFYSKNSDSQYSPNSLYSYYCYDVNGIYSGRGAEMSNNYQAISNEYSFIILHSTHDIYYAKDNNASYSGANYDSVFFQSTLVAQVPLAKAAEEVPGMMVTALKILIPVGLILFGMVLLVSLCRKKVISKKNLTN